MLLLCLSLELQCVVVCLFFEIGSDYCGVNGFYVLFDVNWYDLLVCLDVYGVFVFVECCLFLKSGCCLFCKWMKWVCGVQ